MLALALIAALACRKRCKSGPTPWRSPPSDEGCCSVDVAMSTRAYEERPPRKPQDNLVWVRVRGLRVGLGLGLGLGLGVTVRVFGLDNPAEARSCLSTRTRGRSSGRLAQSTSRVKRVVATPPCAATSREMSSESWPG